MVLCVTLPGEDYVKVIAFLSCALFTPLLHSLVLCTSRITKHIKDVLVTNYAQ